LSTSIVSFQNVQIKLKELLTRGIFRTTTKQNNCKSPYSTNKLNIARSYNDHTMLSCRNLLPFSSKKDLRCEASSMASKNTLNVVMDEKDEAYAKREEKRRREKEEQMLNFVDIIKNLEIQETKHQL
jgi:hypothetical protein